MAGSTLPLLCLVLLHGAAAMTLPMERLLPPPPPKAAASSTTEAHSHDGATSAAAADTSSGSLRGSAAPRFRASRSAWTAPGQTIPNVRVSTPNHQTLHMPHLPADLALPTRASLISNPAGLMGESMGMGVSSVMNPQGMDGIGAHVPSAFGIGEADQNNGR